MLRQRDHECWTASAVGLAAASDDALTVWTAEHDAAVVSTDQEFGRRRSRLLAMAMNSQLIGPRRTSTGLVAYQGTANGQHPTHESLALPHRQQCSAHDATYCAHHNL
jgi:hypothetical protein